MPTIKWKCNRCQAQFDAKPYTFIRGNKRIRCQLCQSTDLDAFALVSDGEFVPSTVIDVQVQRMYRFDTDRPLKAFADVVVNDALLIKGIRVMEGKTGLFVSMPREQAKDTKWYDTVRCLTQEIRDQISGVVLGAYNED